LKIFSNAAADLRADMLVPQLKRYEPRLMCSLSDATVHLRTGAGFKGIGGMLI
jgi:hypothetical protein